MSDRQAEELTANEAAAYLGIKRSSLYTYVSRGWVRGVRRSGHRGRLYPLAELERFERARQEGGLDNSLGSGLPNPDLLGRSAEWPQAGPSQPGAELTAVLGLQLEALAEQLWTGVRPDEPSPWVARGLGLVPVDIAGALPVGALPLDCLPLAISSLATRDPDRFGAPLEADLYRGRRLCLRLAALLGMSTDISRCSSALKAESLAGVLLHALESQDSPPRRAFVDTALGLAALQPAGRPDEVVALAAASGTDLYSAILAGVALLSSPEGSGACGRVRALLAECEAEGGAGRAVSARFRRGEDIPGFGERVAGDREAAATGAGLLAALRGFSEADLALEPLGELVDFMEDSGRGRVRLPLVLVGLELALGLPRGSAEALLALGRVVPWVGLVLRGHRRG